MSRPTALYDALFGLHSGIPACCVWAYLLGRSAPVPPESYGYRPCERCVRSIGAGKAAPASVHRCDIRRIWCAMFVRWRLWQCRAGAVVCVACGRRAGLPVLTLPNGEVPIYACLWCDTDGAGKMRLRTSMLHAPRHGAIRRIRAARRRPSAPRA